MEITINVPEPFAEQLKHYANKHQTSVDELTTAYWQELLQDDIDAAQRGEIEKRWAAYENGEVEVVSHEKFKAQMNEHLAILKTQ